MNRCAAFVGLLALLLPAAAQAKSSFPGQIQQHLQLSQAPSCILCHGSSQGGGPVTQPFGQAMLAAGLTSSGGPSLTRALDTLEADETDSNQDGVSDIAGLREGIEPTAAKPPIEYGCGGAHIAPSGNSGWLAIMLAFGTFGALSWRSARRAADEVVPRKQNQSPT